MAVESNGNFDWQQFVRRNDEEHERIWQSIRELRESNHELSESVLGMVQYSQTTRELTLQTSVDLAKLERDAADLISAIRNLIDRIPPANLR